MRARGRRQDHRLLCHRAGAVWAVTFLAACGGGSADCPGASVFRPVGASLSPERSAEVVAKWEMDEATGLLTINTSHFRFDGRTAVIGTDRVAVRLAAPFTAEDCGSSADGAEAVLQAKYGATFYVDPKSGELVKAACNGCA